MDDDEYEKEGVNFDFRNFGFCEMQDLPVEFYFWVCFCVWGCWIVAGGDMVAVGGLLGDCLAGGLRASRRLYCFG